MRNLRNGLTLMALVLVLGAGSALAHCQIPCGIYDDSTQFAVMREKVTTIEKSMKEIVDLSAAEPVNYNQLVRWVTNKDNHATMLQDIVTEYFMFQRVKPADPTDAEHWQSYIDKLTLLHGIAVNAMKAKQTTDLQYIEKLRQGIDAFEKAYFSH